MDVDNTPMTPLIHEPNIKRRRSFFIPENVSVLEQSNSENNSTEIKYIEKIKAEEKQWKKLYENRKEKHKNLLTKLKTVQTQTIDYDTLDPEDIDFLNDNFDLDDFVESAKKLQDKLKVALLQTEKTCKQKIRLMKNIKKCSVFFETEYCNKI